ncbi:MAG: hypothetical protein ACRDLL_12990 [Solirubrobacterales bacterium]
MAFDATYAAAPGVYIALMSFFNSAGSWWGARFMGGTNTGTNATTIPASTGVLGLEDADRPILNLY